jgi:hypothetical protein
MADHEFPDREPLLHFMHASELARAQLNMKDTACTLSPIFKCTVLLTDIAGLRIMITYQTPLGTEHLEPATPCAKSDTIRERLDNEMEDSTTQATIDMIREELTRQKLEQEGQTMVATEEAIALRQKTDSTIEKLKTLTAVELVRAELVQGKFTDQ